MKTKELKQKIIERLDKSFNNYWHSTTDLIKESVADDIILIINTLILNNNENKIIFISN